MTRAIKLDDLDTQIVLMLQHDGRTSNRFIARELGVSESGVRKRLKRLSERGAINYGLVVDLAATGMSISGLLNIEVTASEISSVANAVAAFDGCVVCLICSGEANVRVWLYAEDNEALAILIDQIAQIPGVLQADFHTAVKHCLHRYQYFINAE